eukprot:g7519.t1
MSPPSPAERSTIDIEIESAHTQVPLGGFSGGSPTGEVTVTPGRKQQGEHGHSGRCLVTLKRKGASDVVKQTHVRSASSGSVSSAGGAGVDGGNSSESNVFRHGDDLEAGGPLCTAVNLPPSPAPLRASRSASGSGGSVGGRGSRNGNMSSLASLEDAAQRIAVDPDTGHSYFVERSTVCDACPYCDDTCEVAWCNGCDERRARLEYAHGPLMLSRVEEGAAGAGDKVASDGVTIGNGAGGGGGGRLKLAPVLSRRYSRKSSYTLCEVRRRKLTGACWVVSQGSVYDVTGALADHPGGKRSVLRNAGGKDCEEDFHFHSRAAKRQWRQYRIGSLVPCRGEMGGDDDLDERSMRTGSDCVIS